MKRPTAIFSTLVSAALLFALTPGVAQAATVTAYSAFSQDRSVTVNLAAKIAKKGNTVQWKVKIKCPKGERYDLTTRIKQVPAAAPPQYPGAQVEAVWAHEEKTGKCSGKKQSFTMTLKVDKTRVTTATGQVLDVFIPLSKTPATNLAQAYMSTNVENDRGRPYYCSFAGTNDGYECEDATQWGPNLALK